MFSDGKQILVKKAIPDCIFCKSSDDLTMFEGKCVCKNCIEKLKAAE